MSWVFDWQPELHGAVIRCVMNDWCVLNWSQTAPLNQTTNRHISVQFRRGNRLEPCGKCAGHEWEAFISEEIIFRLCCNWSKFDCVTWYINAPSSEWLIVCLTFQPSFIRHTLSGALLCSLPTTTALSQQKRELRILPWARALKIQVADSSIQQDTNICPTRAIRPALTMVRCATVDPPVRLPRLHAGNMLLGGHTLPGRVLAAAAPVREAAAHWWRGWVTGRDQGELTPSESTRHADGHAVVRKACGQVPHEQGGVSPIEFARLSSARDGILTSSSFCSE